MSNVPDYRIFVFTRDNRLVDVELVTFPTNDDAQAYAAELVTTDCGAEVWSGAIIVGTFPPREPR
jgi:hypothetical protein